MRLFIFLYAVQASVDIFSKSTGVTDSWRKWGKTVFLKATPAENAEAHRTEIRERLKFSRQKGKRRKRG